MFHVYILFSEKFNKSYVGFTSDLQNRLLSHNALASKGYTVQFRPWKLIYSEVFSTKLEATKREKFFKSGQGRLLLKQIIANFLENEML